MGKMIKNSGFQFTRPIITKLLYSVNEKYLSDEKTTYQAHINKNIQIGEDGKNGIVEVTWEIDKGNGTSNPKYDISITMMSRFSWTDELDEEMINTLLEYNAVSLILGYMRPVISNVTMNSIEPLDIPFYDLR